MTERTRPVHRRTAQDAAGTAARLVEAALGEFRERGFDGTDSNRIARRAGFAPQTFYRWFSDKTEVFVAAYRRWEDSEHQLLAALVEAGAKVDPLARAIIRHHKENCRFRRSLRQLAIEAPAVREARAQSRMRQVERIRDWRKLPVESKSSILLMLLKVERLADAAAEGEHKDLGMPESVLRDGIAALLRGTQPAAHRPARSARTGFTRAPEPD